MIKVKKITIVRLILFKNLEIQSSKVLRAFFFNIKYQEVMFKKY